MRPREDLTPAPCDALFVDAWPLALMRDSAMRAYLALDNAGRIALRYPVIIRAGRLEIRYLAPDLPQAWVLEMLKQAEERIVDAERQLRLTV